MINFYRKYIAEGKAFLIFSIIVSIILRNLLYYKTGYNTINESNNYPWYFIFQNTQFSTFSLFWINFAVILLFGLLLAYTSWHYSLIREKTFLPFAISVMIFSTQQQSLFFSATIIAALLLLAGVCHSFRLYQKPNVQWNLFNIASLFALSSLISIDTLPYACLLFIGLVYLRIFNLRNILSVFLGLIFVFWIGFLVCVAFGHIQSLVDCFEQLKNLTLLHILDFTISEWIYFGLYLFIFIVVLIDFQVNLHKDKIRIRRQLNFLLLLSFLFFLSYCFACWNLHLQLYLIIGTFIIPLSHYFALSFSKSKIIFFYLLAVVLLCIGFGQIYFNPLF